MRGESTRLGRRTLGGSSRRIPANSARIGRRRRRVEQAVQTGRTLLVGLGGGEVAMFLGRFFCMLVRSVLRMGAHIVSRDEFGHLRSERRRFRSALAGFFGVISRVVEGVFSEIFRFEIIVGIIAHGRRPMTGSRGILESQAIFQIVEFWNLQIHLCSTLSVKAGTIPHSRR